MFYSPFNKPSDGKMELQRHKPACLLFRRHCFKICSLLTKIINCLFIGVREMIRFLKQALLPSTRWRQRLPVRNGY